MDAISHRIHGTGIFTYIYQQKNIDPTVGKYISPMDPLGLGKTICNSRIPQQKVEH